METKRGVPTKILSLFLSVLMAFSCFSIALPNLAPESKAAATADQWEDLVNAFTAAYDGGYFNTDSYAVTNVNGNVTVEDTTFNGYIYPVVRALVNVAAATNDANVTDHNATIAAAVKAELATKMTVTEPMNEFIDEVLYAPDATSDDAYKWYADSAWEGLKDDELKPQETLTRTVTVTRTVKAAVLNDYTDATELWVHKTDAPANVQTEYTLTITAVAYEGESVNFGNDYCTVWYQNDEMTVAAGVTAGPDLSAIIAYNKLVNDTDWQASYVAYTEDSLSVVQNHTQEELNKIYSDYITAENAALACDSDYVEKFIGAEKMDAYRAYALACNADNDIPNYRKYIDWINGLPIDEYEGFEDSVSKLTLDENDREGMVALKAQAQAYKAVLDGLSTAKKTKVVAAYGEYADKYNAFINEVNEDIQKFDLNDILTAYEYISETSAPSTYTFPEGSSFYTEEEYFKTTDTTVNEKKAYYEATDKYVEVSKPVLADIATYYERSGAAEPYTYTATADTAIDSTKTYYVKDGYTYTKVTVTEGNPATLGYYEYTPSYSVVAVGNDSFYSQGYVEAGQEPIIDDESLLLTGTWLNSAISYANGVASDVRKSVISDAKLSEMQSLYSKIAEECAYRGFDDDCQAFVDEYEYFVNLMTNTNLKGMGTDDLKGREDDPETVDDPATTDVVENNEYIKGLITEATEHYNAFVSAYNTCTAKCTNNNVRNTYYAFLNKSYSAIGSIYGVLFHRTYDQLCQIRTDINNYGGINTNNFSLVKGDIAAFDEDQEEDGFQNELYTWLVNNRSTVQSRAGSGVGCNTYSTVSSSTYDDMINIYNSLASWKTSADSLASGGWGAFSRAYKDNNTGTYATRYVRDDDFVRYTNGENFGSGSRYDYVVTNTKIETVINKLDTFLKSDSFIKLIDKYDADKGVTNLSAFIENLLTEMVFTDDIVNMIITALYPMIVNLLESELVEMLRTMEINGTNVAVSTASGYDFSWNIITLLNASGADLGDLDLDNGYADGALNGTQGTTRFESVFGGLGVNIYPTAFANSLPDYVNGKSLSTFKSRLRSIGTNWKALDGTGYGGDGDGTLDKADLAWVEWGVTNFDTACTALGTVFNSILPLVRCIFCKQTFSGNVSKLLYIRARDVEGSYKVDLSIDETTGYASGTLTITGVEGFNNLWYPLMEALGITGYTGADSISTDTPMANNANNAWSADRIVRMLLMPVYALIKKLANAPLSTLTSILPNVAYCLSYNLVQPMLSALNLNLNINASLDIDDVGTVTALASWLDVSWIADLFEGTIEDAISDALDFDVPLDIGDMLDLGDMLGCDITNLNAILGKFLSDISLPGINSAYLGRLGDISTKSGSVRTQNYADTGLGAGQYHYITADKADVLYDIIEWVLKAAKNGQLSAILGGLGVELPNGVDSLLTNIDVSGAIAALVELFLPAGTSGSGTSAYEMANYDWYIPGTSTAKYNLSSANFVYLKYANDWTAEKAAYIYNNADDVAKAVLELVDEESAEEFVGISDFVLEIVNNLFSNSGIMNVVDILISLGGIGDGENHTVVNLIKDQLNINGIKANIDLRAWFNSFGYLYAENRILESGEFLYQNKYGEFCVGTSEQTGNNLTEIEYQRSYALAPSGFGGFAKADGDYVPVASNGLGKYGEVSGYYRYVKSTTTDDVAYVWTSGNPDASYSKSFGDLQVYFGEQDEEGNYWHWKFKGNTYTSSGSSINLANNTWYELVDGEENARSIFTGIFCALMTPVMGIVSLLFTADDLNLFNNALTIKGYNCYDGAIVPVLEALGVTGLKSQAQYSADYKMNTGNATTNNSRAAGGFYYLVNKLFDEFNDILSYDYDANGKVTKAPVQKIIELLPQIFYFFQSDGLTTLIKNIAMPVWVLVDTIRPIADADLDDFIHQFLCNTLGLVYNKDNYGSSDVVNFILDLIGLDYIPYTSGQAAKDKNMVDAIYQLTLEDLSLETVVSVVEIFTNLDLSPLIYAFEGMCAGYTAIDGKWYGVHSYSTAYSGGTRGNVSYAARGDSGKAYTLSYYGPDIITVTLSVVLDLLRYKDNAAALDDLIGLTSDYFQTDTLSGMSAAGLLEAIEVIFEESDDSKLKSPNWDYLLENDSVAVRRPTDGYAIAWEDNRYDLLAEFSDMSAYHTINNLAYKTDWTYETAYATDEMLSIVLDYVTTSFLANNDESITGFSDFINKTLDENVFSGELLRTIAGLMAQVYNLVPAEIVDLIDEVLDINMTAWLDAEYCKKDVERTYSDILSNSTKNVDVNGDGVIAEDGSETFNNYDIYANGNLVDENYVPAAGDEIEKYEMTIDKSGNREIAKDDDGNDIASYYIVGAVETEEVEVPATETEPATTKTVTTITWSYIADENFDTDNSEYVANYDHEWWANPEAEGYVDSRDEFIDAIGEILRPAGNLFAFIFLQRDYKFLYTAGDDLTSTGDDTDAIVLDGIGAYADAVVPILEALGVPLTTAQYDALEARDAKSASYYTRGDYSPAKYGNDGAAWLDDMLDLFVNLATEIIDDPINWILNKMPGFIYFVNADGITVAMENLFADLDEALDTVNSLLDVEDRLSLGNLAGLDFSDFTLSGVFKLIYKFTGIYVSEELQAYMNSLFVGTLDTFYSANGTTSFTMYYNTNEDRADFITIFVSLLIEIIEDEGRFVDLDNAGKYTYYSNPKAIDALIDSDLEEGESGIVDKVLKALRDPADIIYKEVNWNYFDEEYDLSDNTEDGKVITPGYAFQYLNYSTQWTYSSAATTADGFESLILGVLGLVSSDYADMTSLSELINTDTIFKGELLQSILDLVAPILFGEDAVLNETLLELIGCVLGADLTEWNNEYAFASELKGTVAHDDEWNLDYAMMDNYVLTSDEEIDADKTYYELFEGEYTRVAAPVVEDIATYYEFKANVKTYLVNDAESFANGLTLLVEPAYRLFAWILFGEDYEFYNGNLAGEEDRVLITIQGSHGYKEGLSILIEALGFKNMKSESAYLNEDGSADMQKFTSDFTNSLVNRLLEIAADPVNEIVALIPELIYFINANGLMVSVQNLLAGPLNLVASLADLFVEEGVEADYDLSDPVAVINNLLEGVLAEALGDLFVDEDYEFKFDLNGINLGYVIELAEAITGLELTDLTQQSLSKFYIGKIDSYNSKSDKLAYKMSFDKSFLEGGNGNFADFITILLSYVIDAALYPGNAEAICALINGEKTAEDDGYISPALIQGAINFIKEGYVVNSENIDWFYFDTNNEIHTITAAENTETGVTEYTYTGSAINPGDTVTVPGRTINYLTYASDWTEDTAEYVVRNRDRLVAAVLSMLGMGDTTLAEAVKGVFDINDIYNTDTLNAIFDLVAPVIESLPEVVLTLADVIIDIDVSFYADESNRFADGEELTRDEFVAGLVKLLEPLNAVLDWLFFGKDLTYFDRKDYGEVKGSTLTAFAEGTTYYEAKTLIQNGVSNNVFVETKDVKPVAGKTYYTLVKDAYGNITHTTGGIEYLINIPGADGYKWGLVPILEALGVQLPTVNDDDDTAKVMPILINNVLARVEAILANPMDEILELLPNLLYFINANGLSVSVHNLVCGVFALLDTVNETLEAAGEEAIDINGLISSLLSDLPFELDINNLDLLAIVRIVEALTAKTYYVKTSDTEVDEEKTYYVETEDGYEKVETPNAAEMPDYYEAAHTEGLRLAEVVTANKIDNFYLGEMVYYTSANGKAAYKMQYCEDEDMADMLTVLVNFVLEVLLYEDGDFSNADVIDALINGVDENGEPTKNTVKGIVDIILNVGTIDDGVLTEINWNFFDEDVTLTDDGVTVPGNAFVYLDYCNDWTYDKAAYIDENLVNIIDTVLALTTAEGEEPITINDFISGVVDLDELLNADLLNTILDFITPLLYGDDSIINEYFFTVIGVVLDIDLTTWNNYYRFEEYDASQTYTEDAETGLKYRTGSFSVDDVTYTDRKIFAIEDAYDFASGLAYLIKPAERLIGWLLLDQNIGFFVSDTDGNVDAEGLRQQGELIRVNGFNGYDRSLVILLEALGCVVEPASEFAGEESRLIKSVLDAVITRLDEILADPVNELLALIPELLYFINAGGLNAVVMNLAGGIFDAIDYVNESGVLGEGNEIDLDLNEIISGAINTLLAKNAGKEVDELTEDEKFTFELETFNLQTVIDVAELFTGLEISGAIGYSLSKFVLGEVYAYETSSAAYADNTYKVRFSDEENAANRADLITILFSVVLDVLREPGNSAALVKLINNEKVTEVLIDSIVNVLNGWTVDTMEIEWFYPITKPAVEDASTIDGTTPIVMVERTINYLSYASDWTEEKAEYIMDNLDGVIAEVLELTGSEKTTVAEILEGYFKISDLYTADNLNAIVKFIKDITEDLGDVLTTVLGLVVFDNEEIYEAYENMEFTDDEITDRATFAEGLAEVINPISSALDWLLFGDDYKFFYDNDFYTEGNPSKGDLLTLTGGEGYLYAIVPLLETLGVNGLPTIGADTKTKDVLATVIEVVLNRAEEILADPVNEIIDILPNLIYFINANGISVVVNNLLASVIGLLDEALPAVIEIIGNEIEISEGVTVKFTEDKNGDGVAEVISVEEALSNLVNGLVKGAIPGFEGFNLKSIKLLDIVKMIEAATGLRIADVVTENKIENFYLGGLTYYKSTNGKAAFRMEYTDSEDKADFLTILLNLLVEVLLYEDGEFSNAAVLDEMLGTEGMIQDILGILEQAGEAYIPGDFHWAYFNEENDEGNWDAETCTYVVSTDMTLPKQAFNNHLKYTTDWTQKTADTLYDNIDDVITAVLTLAGKEDNTVAKMLKGMFTLEDDLYTAELLNKILELTAKLYELLGTNILGVLGLVIDCDLNAWDGLEFTDEQIYDRDTFLNGLCEILEPLHGLLDWLLFGDSFNFFVDNATGEKTLINIAGNYGYLYGLVPILKALGVELPEYGIDYYATKDIGGQTFLRAVLESVLIRAEEILADPVDEALDLITSLLYFINANGLSSAAYNLAGGIVKIVDYLDTIGMIDVHGSIRDYVNDELGLNIDNLDLEGIIGFVQDKFDLKGIKIYELFNGTYDPETETFTYIENGDENILEKFYVGELEDYTYCTSASHIFNGYVMKNADHDVNGGRGDIITMLLSIVLDVIFYEGNEEPLAALIDGLLGDDVTFTTENFVALKALLMSGADFEQTFGANWLYWTGLTAEEQQAEIEAVLSADVTAIPELPMRTVNYLELDNNWNQETSDYLDENIEDIVDLVINLITEGSSETLEAFIADKLDIYTTDTAQAILDKIGNLLAKLDETLTEELKDELLVTAGSLLGVDIQALVAPVTEIDDNASRGVREQQFVDVLSTRLASVARVLDWLLFDEELTFFTKLEDSEPMITISGGEGYKYGLAPLLEAIGVDTKIDASLTCQTGAIKALLTNVAARIDQILYGENGKTIDEVLALLPELIYFINAGGVNECIENLLQPADELLTIVNEELGNGAVVGKNSVEEFVTFTFNENTYKLNEIGFDFLFDLVIDKTGIDIENATGLPADASVTLDTVGNYIKNFYFGELQSYTSYGDIQAVRMVYTDRDDRIDMITLLVTLVLDVAFSGNNKDTIIGIIDNVVGEDAAVDGATIYSTVIALLTDRNVEIQYQKYDWLFTTEPYNFADSGKLVSATSIDGTLFTDIYGPLYTRAMGEYMTKYLELLIQTYLTLLGVEINGVNVRSTDDLLDQLVGTTIYKTEYLELILNAVTGLLDNLKTTLGVDLFNHISNILNTTFGIDLNYWEDYVVEEIPENDSAKFVDEVCRMLRPAYPILKWLLTSEDIAIFNKTGTSEAVGSDANDYILLQGAEGYRYGIVPILEALENGDSSEIISQTEYEALVAQDEDNLLRVILNRVVALIDRVFENPIEAIVNLVPGVAYFMNSYGLDTAVKNLLGAAYNLLYAIDPLIANVEALHQEDGTVDLLALAGIDLREITLNSLMDKIAGEDGLKIKIGEQELELGSAVVDLAKELAVGYVESYDSKINTESFFQNMYTMTVVENQIGAGGTVGDGVDIVTVLMRLLLKLVSDNPEFIKGLLKDNLSGDGYTLLASLVDNFAAMSGTQDGMDKIMYTVYYVFYSALVAGVSVNNGMVKFNGDYSFLYNLFATSDVKTLNALAETWKQWLHVGEKTDDETGESQDGPFTPIIDEDEVAPNGFISFFQKIIEFFQKIANFFKNLF